MHKIVFLSFFSLILASQDQPSVFEIKKEHSSLPLLIGIIGQPIGQSSQLDELAALIAHCFSRTGYYTVTTEHFADLRTKQEMQDISQRGFAAALFVQLSSDQSAYEWRIYDTTTQEMVRGKRVAKDGQLARSIAYRLADDCWKELNGFAGSFSSKIAYIKRMQVGKKKQSALVTCDFDGSHEKIIAKVPQTLVGLQWHYDTTHPRIFSSLFTRYNVQLCSFDMQGKKRVVVDLDGTCVGISLNQSMTVYCRSGKIWKYTYDPLKKRGTHACIIKNEGKNSSPILLENGDIIFCSDALSLKKADQKSKNPAIYYYHTENRSIEPITDQGYCLSPSYNPVMKKIAYSKRIDGIMQLCIYDMTKKQHEQLTFDAGNKIDCTWSPCGNYLAFCLEEGKQQRIVVIDRIFKTRWTLTGANDQCCSPSWSNCYAAFPL